MPLDNVLLSILTFFLLAAWVWVLVGVVADVFRSRDLGGLAKALWVVFILLLPWLGILFYLVARGHGMAARQHEAMIEAEELHRTYIREAAGTSTADEIAKLAALKDKGILTEAEYAAQKSRLLSSD